VGEISCQSKPDCTGSFGGKNLELLTYMNWWRCG